MTDMTTGRGNGQTVLIPRTPIIISDLPFSFERLQFPVSPCFSMTINKSQGQTVKVVGIDLTTPCFSYVQHYVAFSRVSSPNNLFFLIPKEKAENVVYKEVLD